MGRRVEVDKDEKVIRAIRPLRESGGSNVVTIPPEMIDLADFEVGDDVELQAEMFGDEIRVRVVQPDADGDTEPDDEESGSG